MNGNGFFRDDEPASSRFLWRNRGGVANDLPSCGSFFHHEQKIAVDVAASRVGSLQVKVSGYSCKLRVQRLNLEIRKTQRAHLLFGVVTLAIGVEHLVVATRDL